MVKKIGFFVFVIGLLLLLNPVWIIARSAMPRVGEKAPDFSLPDQHGKIHHLSDYKGRIVLLAFYPADFTKGCTLEAHVNTRYQSAYKKAGIAVLGISVQTPKSHKAFCETEGIHYTLLADSKGKVAALYGVLGPGVSTFPEAAWYAHPKRYAALYHETNPHPVDGLANRVTFIIGKSGRIAYADAEVNRHLTTCAPDWIAWVKAHKNLLQ